MSERRLPPDAVYAPAPVAADAMRDAPDRPELLDVELQQIAGRRPFLPIDGTQGVQTTRVLEPDPPLLASHWREGKARIPRNPRKLLCFHRAFRCGAAALQAGPSAGCAGPD